jgi:hypothetical protein
MAPIFLQKDSILKKLTRNAAMQDMFTKCPLHFLGTSGGNIMTHAYWWKFNTVMWNKKYQSDMTAL